MRRRGEHREGGRGKRRKVSMTSSLINVWLTGVTLKPPTHNPPLCTHTYTHTHPQIHSQEKKMSSWNFLYQIEMWLRKTQVEEKLSCCCCYCFFIFFHSPPIVTDDALVTMGTIKCHHLISLLSSSRLCAHVLSRCLVNSGKHPPHI